MKRTLFVFLLSLFFGLAASAQWRKGALYHIAATGGKYLEQDGKGLTLVS